MGIEARAAVPIITCLRNICISPPYPSSPRMSRGSIAAQAIDCAQHPHIAMMAGRDKPDHDH